ncbi:MAG: DUF4097 family beta strand repeat-containing protein [Oscillospiraceae bacterium]
MKKAKKTALVIALACVAAGAVISLGALAVIGFDVSRLNTMKFETNTYQVEESFSNIRIEGAECAVRLLPSQTDACTVVCSEGKNISHTVAVDGDTLKITRTDNRKWYECMGIYWGDEMSVTVCLPGRVYGDLFIRSMSGDITVPGDFTFSRAEIINTSGEIDYAAATGNALTLKTTSGDLNVRDLTAGALEVRSTSGKMEISNVKADSLTAVTTSGDVVIRSAGVGGGVAVETVSGEIGLERVNAQTVSVQSTSGEVELTDTVAAGRVEIETVSGEIELERSDGETLWIKSTSGDVSGTLLTEKRFTIHTTSGTVNVPNVASPSAGTCEIITTSGNIRIKLS